MRLLVILLVLVPSVAFADRTTVVNLGGGVGIAGNVDSTNPDGVGGPRATLAWETDPLAIPPDEGTFDLGGQLVPELVVGTMFEKDRAEGFLGVGLRAELKIAQNAMGLLKWTTRGGAYLSARGLVIGETRDVMYEFGVGQYFERVKNFTRFGYEIQILNRPHFEQMDNHYMGFLFSLYVGWAP